MDPRDAGDCARRADHAVMAPGAAAMALRLAVQLDAPMAAELRRVLLRLGCDHDLARCSDAALDELLTVLLATGGLYAVECAPRPRGADNRLPPDTVPIHIGSDGTAFDDCPRHRTHVQIALTDVAAAQELLQRCRDGSALSAVERTVASEAPAFDPLPVAERAALLLVAGRLTAVQCPRPLGPTGRKVAPAPAPKAAPAPVKEQRKKELEKTWIEFRVVRSRDQAPVPGARYRLELADGTVRTGAADAEGVIYEKGIEPGSAKVTLLEYERDEWRRK